MAAREKVNVLDMFGLLPFDKAVREAAMSLFGKGRIPPSQFDITSLKIMRPRVSIPIWLGLTRNERKVPIYNFFNVEKAPDSEPYSVKVTFARDFLGGAHTYDGHVGVDFAVPVGTRIVTAAPGRIIRIARHFDHGGLKIYIDHGAGLVTMYEHLTRVLVEEGDCVERGQFIAISGCSGIDMFFFTPWVAPHLHFNVVLNGRPADPFAPGGETPLWLSGNSPEPHTGARDSEFDETAWNDDLLDAAIRDCSDDGLRADMYSFSEPEKRAAEIIGDRISYKTLFSEFPPIYEKEFERRPLLDLPFSSEDFDGVSFP